MKISLSRRQNSKKAMDHGWFYEHEVNNINTFADLIKKSVWSPIVWTSGRRMKANFLTCKYLALDFDEGFTLLEAQEWVAKNNYAAIIGTSKSHQKEKVTPSGKIQPACDRFRVVIPFAKELTSLVEYETNMAHVMETLHCDPSCKDGGRFFFPCKDIILKVKGTEYTPLTSEELENIENQKQRRLALVVSNRESMKRSGTLPTWTQRILTYGIDESESRHQYAYRVGAALEPLGYDEAEVVNVIMASKGNLKDIGFADVERAVKNGYERSRRDTHTG